MAGFNNEMCYDRKELENCVSKDDNEENAETILKNIFTSCDVHKCGLVAVSKIIEYVTPYMDNNDEQVADLKHSLDPTGNDPLITPGVFLRAMKEWTEKFGDNSTSESNVTPTKNDYRSNNRIACISTPSRDSIDPSCLPLFKAGQDMNISNISNYSLTSLGGLDPNLLQEQINELQYQNRKLNDMVSEIRNQLIQSEEQNSVLQNDVDKLTRRLQSEQKVNEMYQIERKEHEEYRESADSIIKKYEHVNQKLLVYKKEMEQLKQDNDDLERQNRKLNDTITQLRNKESRNPKIEQLRIELSLREKEIESLVDTQQNLKEQMREYETQNQELVDKIEHIKYEKTSLEKRLNHLINRQDSSLHHHKEANNSKDSTGNSSYNNFHPSHKATPFAPQIQTKNFQFFNFDSPITRSLSKTHTIYTPGIAPLGKIRPRINDSDENNPKNKDFKIRSKIPVKINFKYGVYSPRKSNDSDYQTPPCDTPKLSKSKSVENISIQTNFAPQLINVPENHEERMSQSLTHETEINDSFELAHTDLLDTVQNTSYDDDLFWNMAHQSPSIPRESLKSEMEHATVTVEEKACCDDAYKLLQSEMKRLNLEEKIKEHENCHVEVESKKQEINRLLDKLNKVSSNVDKLTRELNHEREKKSANEKSEKVEELLHKAKTGMKELEEVVKAKDAEITKLRNKEQKMKDEFGKLRSSFDEVKLKYSQTKIEIEQHKKDKEKAYEDLKKSQKTQDEFYQRCVQVNKDMETLSNDIKELKTQKENLEKNSKFLEEQCCSYKKNAIKWKEELDKINREEIKNTIKKLEKERDNLKIDNKYLTEQYKIFENGVIKWKEEYNKAKDAKEELNNRLRTMEEQINFLTKDNVYLEQQYTKYKENASKLSEEIASIERVNATNIELYNKKMHDISIELDSSKKCLSEKQEKIKKMDQLLIVMQSLEEANDKYKIKIENLKKYQENCKDMKDLNESLKDELKEKTRINEDISEELHKIKGEMTKFKNLYEKDLNEWKQLEKALTEERQKVIKELTQFKIDMIKREQHFESELNDRNKNERAIKDSFNKQIKQNQDRIVELTDHKRNLLSENSKLKEEINGLTQEKNDLTQEKMDLEEEMTSMKSIYEKEKSEKAKLHNELQEKICLMINESKLMEAKINELQSKKICGKCKELEEGLQELRTRGSSEDRNRTNVNKTRRDILMYRCDKLDEQLAEEKEKNKQLSTQLSNLSLDKSSLESMVKEFEKEKKEILADREKQLQQSKKLNQGIEQLELKLLKKREIVTDLKTRLNENEEKMGQGFLEFNSVTDELRKQMATIREFLKIHTVSTADSWKDDLRDIIPDSPLLFERGLGDAGHMTTSTEVTELYTSVSNEFMRLEGQVKNTIKLLKSFEKLKHGKNSKTGITEKSTTTSDDSSTTSVEAPRPKFVLRPPVLILHSQMSPDSPSTEMTDVSTRITTKIPELNNNIPPLEMGRTQIDTIDSNLKNEVFVEETGLREIHPRGERIFRSSESSSSDTDSTESCSLDLVLKPDENPRRLSAGAEQTKNIKEGAPREVRSMSDGAANIRFPDFGDVTVFPNLQDNELESLGLLGDGPRDRLTEEEIESKFQTLTLAFQIDARTLQDRRDRQLRQRDQAETNMKNEIDRLVRAIHRLNPLCVDAEKTELVTSLLGQLDVIDQAATRISTSAEVFGSVQQEWRMAESFNLMLNHLKNLTHQRDTARRQLQCTKRMLQESTEHPSGHAGRLRTPLASNGKLVTRRRASIAAIPRPTEAKLVGSNSPDRRLPRRTSAGCAGEMSPRLWEARNRLEWNERLQPANRSLRPGRLELGVDLGKIREGTVESALHQECEENCEESETESHDYQTPTTTGFPEIECPSEFEYDEEPPTVKRRLARKFQRIGAKIEQHWKTLSDEGTIHEFCCLGAIICFAMCTIILGNIMIEMEYAKRGVPVLKVPWSWTTWEELFSPFIRINYPNGPPPI